MTTVLGVLGVLVVLFVVAAVALRDEAVLVEAPPDRADLDLPGDGPVTAGDLERVRFGMALRGYRMAQVDAVLDRVARELLERDEQLAALSSEVERLRGQGPAEAAGPAPTAEPELVAATAALAQPLPEITAEITAAQARPPGAAAARVGETGAVLMTEDETAGPVRDDEQTVPVAPVASEPPVEHVPDSEEPAEPLPGVTERPGADPPAPVPFPEPVHTDEPVQPPGQPDAVRRSAPPRPAPARGASRDAAVAYAGQALHLARRLRSRLAARR